MSKKTGNPKSSGQRLHLRLLKQFSKIHQLIINKTYPNTEKLASELEVSKRTIRRYISQMRDELNAPIDYSRKKNGYFYTHPNWETPLISLTEGELLAFFIATVALQGKGSTYEDERLRRAIAKISGSLPEAISVSLGYLFENTSFQAPSHVIANGETLDKLYRAIGERETIKFIYSSPNTNETKARKVNPLLLHNHEGTWYVISWDVKKQGYRNFHTGRIKDLQKTNEFFELPKTWDKNEYLSEGFGMYSGGKKTDVEIIFDEYQSKWMRERNFFHPQETREELKDGKMKLSFTIGENGLEAVARFCLQYAGHCVAVKPDKLRNIIKEKLEKALSQHR